MLLHNAYVLDRFASVRHTRSNHITVSSSRLPADDPAHCSCNMCNQTREQQEKERFYPYHQVQLNSNIVLRSHTSINYYLDQDKFSFSSSLKFYIQRMFNSNFLKKITINILAEWSNWKNSTHISIAKQIRLVR